MHYVYDTLSGKSDVIAYELRSVNMKQWHRIRQQVASLWEGNMAINDHMHISQTFYFSPNSDKEILVNPVCQTV